MSTPETTSPDSRQGSAPGYCPCCGQRLLTQEAVRHARQSELEFDRRLDAAAQARVAEVANELLVDLGAEHPHPEKLERLPGDVEEAPRTTTELAYSRIVDRLHGLLRQF